MASVGMWLRDGPTVVGMASMATGWLGPDHGESQTCLCLSVPVKEIFQELEKGRIMRANAQVSASRALGATSRGLSLKQGRCPHPRWPHARSDLRPCLFHILLWVCGTVDRAYFCIKVLYLHHFETSFFPQCLGFLANYPHFICFCAVQLPTTCLFSARKLFDCNQPGARVPSGHPPGEAVGP